MKTIRKALFPGLAAVIVLLCSCEKNPEPNIHGDGSAGANYSYGNDLQKMQLKGAVKTLTSTTERFRTTYVFNPKGYRTFVQYNYTTTTPDREPRDARPKIAGTKTGKTERSAKKHKDGEYTEKYVYNAAGRLTGIYTESDTLRLSYGNHGAYVPIGLFTDYDFGNTMIQNLSLVVYEDGYSTTTITFRVDQSILEAYRERYYHKEWIHTEINTQFIYLNAAKMPASLDDYSYITSWSYYPDNMLKEILISNSSYSNKTLFSFDKTYLLITEKQTSYSDYNGTIDNKRTIYTYNEQKDLQTESFTPDGYTLKHEYIYDDKGNWIRKYIYKEDENPDLSKPYESRIITYY